MLNRSESILSPAAATSFSLSRGLPSMGTVAAAIICGGGGGGRLVGEKNPRSTPPC